MFSYIQAEVLDRIFHTQMFLKSSSSSTTPSVAKTVKGMIFIQLYATYEYTITESFSAAMNTISSYAIPVRELNPCLLTIVLDPQWNSLRNSKREKTWDKRLKVIDSILSKNSATSIHNNVFPFDGSHFRFQQIQTIWNILGINVPILSHPRHKGRISEFVEHRNAIAHGRKTAAEVGGRFSDDDLELRIADIQDICIYINATIETHCMVEENIRVNI